MDCLVLSPEWEPIDQISWQRAITLFWLDKVEILEEYEDREVHSKTISMKIPAVIRLIKNIVGKKRGVRFSRENVYTRDKGRCQYCKNKIARLAATYDHVKPRRQGGQTRWNNIVISCRPCNQRKGGRTPQQAGMRLTVEPSQPKYLPETLRVTFTKEAVPKQWGGFLRNVVYMHEGLK